MQQYDLIIRNTQHAGTHKGDRTNTGTQSRFGQTQHFSLRNNNLPTVTGKYTHLHSVFHELFWMISGDTRLEYLIANKVRIWNEWVKPDTAIFEALTPAQLEQKLTDKWRGKALFVFTAGQSATYKFHSPEDYFKDVADEQIENFWTQYPDLTKEQRASFEIIVEIDVTAWSKTIGAEWKPLPPETEEDTHFEFMIRLHRLIFKSEPRRLVGGDLGPVYGKTWRDIEDTRVIPKSQWNDFEARGFKFVVDVPGTDHTTDRCVVTRQVDQLQDLIEQLGSNPDSRRLIISAWDPCLIDEQALPPCHSLFQFWTRELSTIDRLVWLEENDATRYEQLQNYRAVADESIERWLDDNGVPKRGISCQLYARSQDVFLGVPFNITFYSMLTHMLANQFNFVAESFFWVGGDVHIYSNHVDQVEEYKALPKYDTPTVHFKPEAKGKDIREITMDDFEVRNYVHGPRIAAKVAV
jgi:thymidylate synthase